MGNTCDTGNSNQNKDWIWKVFHGPHLVMDHGMSFVDLDDFREKYDTITCDSLDAEHNNGNKTQTHVFLTRRTQPGQQHETFMVHTAEPYNLDAVYKLTADAVRDRVAKMLSNVPDQIRSSPEEGGGQALCGHSVSPNFRTSFGTVDVHPNHNGCRGKTPTTEYWGMSRLRPPPHPHTMCTTNFPMCTSQASNWHHKNGAIFFRRWASFVCGERPPPNRCVD